MTLMPDTRVLLISLAGSPPPDLARIAVRNDWPLLLAARVSQALREVRERRPGVVIVPISRQFEDELELLRLLPTKTQRVSSIACASAHDDRIERAIRNAGADSYLPTAADDALVERTVNEILTRRQATPLPMHYAARTAAECQRLSSSSSFSPMPTESSGRRASSARRPLSGTGNAEMGQVV